MDQEKMTPEEQAEQEMKNMEFMTSKLPFLKLQLEFEDLMTKVEEAKTRRLMTTGIQIKYRLEQERMEAEAKAEKNKTSPWGAEDQTQ